MKLYALPKWWWNWLPSKNFFEGEIYCYANFSIVFGGANCLRDEGPFPLRKTVRKHCVTNICLTRMFLIQSFSRKCFRTILTKKGDVEFDVKNRNSSIVSLYTKSKCANLACVLLDQLDNKCTLKEFQKLICFPGNWDFKKCIVLECRRFIY